MNNFLFMACLHSLSTKYLIHPYDSDSKYWHCEKYRIICEKYRIICEKYIMLILKLISHINNLLFYKKSMNQRFSHYIYNKATYAALANLPFSLSFS